MDIIVHFPQDSAELAKRVSAVHAQAIVGRVKSLTCPPEQKAALLDAVKEYVQKGG